MASSRQHRVAQVWTWLPAFRAVAEVEHVQGAARILHVTPSSLSRAIRLLEENIGRKLFDRIGRNIRLNQDGAELLAAVRTGMRGIDDGIARVTGALFAGELRVACEGDQPIAFAWAAAARLSKKYSELRTIVEQTAGKTETTARLLRGELDIAILASLPAENARMLVEHLGDVTYGIYCGVGHPLHRRDKIKMSEICTYPFVAPTVSDNGPDDQWPRGVQRNVTLRLPSLQPAIAACANGELLAVLPDLAVARSADRAVLRRLPSDAIPSSALFTVRRHPTGDVDRAALFAQALRETLGHRPLKKARSSRKKA